MRKKTTTITTEGIDELFKGAKIIMTEMNKFNALDLSIELTQKKDMISIHDIQEKCNLDFKNALEIYTKLIQKGYISQNVEDPDCIAMNRINNKNIPIYFGYSHGSQLYASLCDLPNLFIYSKDIYQTKKYCDGLMCLLLDSTQSNVDVKFVATNFVDTPMNMLNNKHINRVEIIETVNQLESKIFFFLNEIEQRENKFHEYKVNNIYDYNKVAAEKMDYYVLYVDDISFIRRNKRLYEKFFIMMLNAKRSGIHTIFASSRYSKELHYYLKDCSPVRVFIGKPSQTTTKLCKQYLKYSKLCSKNDVSIIDIKRIGPESDRYSTNVVTSFLDK